MKTGVGGEGRTGDGRLRCRSGLDGPAQRVDFFEVKN